MQLPECRNYRRRNGSCAKSDMVVRAEQDEAWVLQCKTCECVQVVSKDGVRDRSRFENSLKRQQQQEAVDRLWQKRKKIFA